MIFSTPLQKGRLIKRYKRFLADIELDSGKLTTAHCPNPGALQGFDSPGTVVWVSESSNPSRKLPFTWEMAEIDGRCVGMNTSHPNELVTEALRAGGIPELHGYTTLRREVTYGKNSRIDILLDPPLTYVEIKNVHLKRGNKAVFPSSVTARGAKHMRELSEMVHLGHSAYVIYVVQRNDCEAFEIAHDIDPLYGQEATLAFENGVKPLVYACDVSPKGIKLVQSIRFKT